MTKQIITFALTAALAARPLALRAQGILGADTIPDTARIQPRTKADSLLLAGLVAHLANPDSVHFRRFARIQDKWIPVSDSTDWPEGTETSLLIYRPPEQARPAIIMVAPTSQSGDWSLEDTYFFDAAGNTVHLVHFFGSFADACDAKVVHETSRYWFATTSRLLAKTFRLTEGREGRDLDPDRCRPPFTEAYDIAPTAKALLHGLGADGL